MKGKNMLKSMTGYGQGKNGNCRVEIRALNRRFCEVNVKLPPFLFFFEEEIKKIVKCKIKRGKIDVFVNLTESVMLNRKDEFKLDFFMSLPGILKIKKTKINTKKLLKDIKNVLYQALVQLERMRKNEGKIIGVDFTKRVKKINSCFSKIKLQLPKAVKKYENKLWRDKLQNFLKGTQKSNEKTFLLNSIIAERMEVTEEVVRFKSHLGQFVKTFKNGSEVGKKMDFIIQEMSREINTIGAKVNNYEISCEVIQIKSELEKLKEQIQNVV
jgi:uncharacterized protein (TIGR00255 family)